MRNAGVSVAGNSGQYASSFGRSYCPWPDRLHVDRRATPARVCNSDLTALLAREPSILAPASLLVLVTAMPEGAADLGRMPTKAPIEAAPPPFTWTGCYIGCFIGGAVTNDASS